MTPQRQKKLFTNPKSSIFNSVLIFFYFSIGAFSLFKHGMWRDELQAWLIARDSSSIPNLLFNMRYEGHPPLWHAMLYFITRFTHQPVYMQLLHLLIATLAMWVFLKYSPFSRLQKTLFIFGYFPFYEYLVFSRNYMLGVLFIFIFCAVFPFRNRRYILLFGLLFLLAQSNLIGAIIAIVFGLLLLFEIPADTSEAIGGALVFIFTLILLFFQTRLPPDSYFEWATGYFINIDPSRIINTVSELNKIYAFNLSVIFRAIVGRGMNDFVMSLVGLFFISIIFLRRPKILFAYLLGTFGLLMFFYIKDGIILRHYGYLYILLIACLWLSYNLQPKELKPAFFNKIAKAIENCRGVFIIFILSVHFFYSIPSLDGDRLNPISTAKKTAQFIKDQHMEKMIMVGEYDVFVSSIAGYLDNKIYYPRISRFGSYCLWNKERFSRSLNSKVIIQDARNLMMKNRQSVLIILSYKLAQVEITNGIKEVGQFTGSSFGEDYFLYLLSFDKFSQNAHIAADNNFGDRSPRMKLNAGGGS